MIHVVENEEGNSLARVCVLPDGSILVGLGVGALLSTELTVVQTAKLVAALGSALAQASLTHAPK